MNPGAAGGRRLDPFSFPAETNLRFILFVLAGLLITCRMSLVVLAVFAEITETTHPIARSLREAGRLLEADTSASPGTAVAVVVRLLEAIALNGVLVPVVVVAAIVIYRTHPARIRRRRHLQTPDGDSDPRFASEVRALMDLGNIIPRPAVEIEKDFRSQDAQAFGLPGAYELGLGAGLRLLLRKDQDAARAIVLHELGHIANRDIGRAYFAQAFWTAVITLALGPAMAGIAVLLFRNLYVAAHTNGMGNREWRTMVGDKLPDVAMLTLQVGVVLLGMAAIRAGLMRVREHYADWRADMWGEGLALSNILRSKMSGGKRGSIARLLRLHPTPGERLRVLGEPAELFRVTPDLPLGVGFLLGLVLGNMVDVVGSSALALGMLSMAVAADLIPRAEAYSSFILVMLARLFIILAGGVALASLAITFLGLGYAVSRTLGLQVQRETVEALVSKRKGRAEQLRLWVWAGLTGVGVEIALLFQPLSENWPHDITGAFLVLVWLAGLTISAWLSLTYIRYFGQRLLGSHTGNSPPKWSRRSLAVAFAALLGAFYLPLTVGGVLLIPSTDVQNQQAAGLFTMVGLGVALILYSIAFAGTWILVELKRHVSRPRCPSCGLATVHRTAVNERCEHCNRELACWLFAGASSRLMKNG